LLNLSNSALDIKFKYFSELAKKFISRLDQPEDWKRPYRYCVARYFRQILKDDIFSENLHYNKDINDRYIYRYTIISRLKESALIKRLNLLTYEEKKQLFILKDWEKNFLASSEKYLNFISKAELSFFSKFANRISVQCVYDSHVSSLYINPVRVEVFVIDKDICQEIIYL